MTNSATVSKDIKPVAIEEEMKKSYLDYAMSVIVSRALPDARDGLKPVHRRILYAMKDAGNDYNRAYRKSARTVGDVMGKFHPHGNLAIYDALVRMAQDFSLRVPLIDGQGNFGSMDGDPAAAERYTEARLSRASHELLSDIDKSTVDFQPNYDESQLEPKVLPARFPNLLVNGCNGIAVGMATNIPTHNLSEVIDGCLHLIENPEAEIKELMSIIPGPDFPTGGIILGRQGIFDAYNTGRGSFIIRGRTQFEDLQGGRKAIIVTEIPFQVVKSRMVERMAEVVKDKLVEGISYLRDESNREGVRVVIELKKDAIPEVVLNQLYHYTPLQTSYSINMLALVHGRPEQLSIKRALETFIAFREEVISRRTRYELEQTRNKAHILVGLSIAVAHLDEMIELIRSSADRQIAKERILSKTWAAHEVFPLLKLVEIDQDHIQESYQLTEAQAQGILDLRLHRLTGLEQQKITEDLKELAQVIEKLLLILGSRERMLEVLKEELLEVKNLFAKPRLTTFEEVAGDFDVEDLIQPEDMVVTISHGGYIKRVPLNTYRAQKRGGKGKTGTKTHEDDDVRDIIVSNTHSPLLVFSTRGRVYQMKTYKLPLGSPQSKGRSIMNLFPLTDEERIATILVGPTAPEDWERFYIIFVTSKGNVRRNKLSDFQRIFASGKKAILLEEGEELIGVQTCDENADIMLATRMGKSVLFPISALRVFAGRDSHGVRGIKLMEDDSVVSMTIFNQGSIDVSERSGYLKMAAKLRQELEDEESEETTEDLSESGDNSDEAAISEERFNELQEKEQFILTITENGYGRRCSSYAYRVTNRGVQGVINMKVTSRIGPVVASFPVGENDDVVLVTNKGKIIRFSVSDVRITSRGSQGVIVFRVENDEKVVSASCVSEASSDTENEEELTQEENQGSQQDISVDDSQNSSSSSSE